MPTCPKCNKILSTDQALQYHMQSSGCKMLSCTEIDKPKYDYEFHINLKGEFIYVSQKFSKLLNWSHEDILGTKAFEYLHPDDRDHVRDVHVDFLLNKIPGYAFMRMIDKEGDSHFVEHFHEEYGSKIKICGNKINFLEDKIFCITDKSWNVLTSNNLFKNTFEGDISNLIELVYEDDIILIINQKNNSSQLVRYKINSKFQYLETKLSIKDNYYFLNITSAATT